MSQTEIAFPGLFKNRYFVLMILIVAAIAVGAVGALDPLILLGGVVFFCLLMVFLKWPSFSVIFVASVIYTNTAVVLIRFHGAPKILGYALPALLAIPLIWQVFVHKQKIKFDLVFILMMVYFSVIVLGSVFSRDIYLAIPNVINFIAEGLVLYFLCINTIRTPKLLKQVIWSLLIGGGLIGGLALFQQITGTFNSNYWGYAQVVAGDSFTTQETLQGAVVQHRASGPIGEKNRFAQIMLMMVPIGLFQAWGEQSRKLRLAALVFTGLIFVGASLAFSRGAQVGFLLLIIIMTFMRYIKIRHLLVLVVGIALLLIAFPQNATRFLSLGEIFSSQEEGGLRSADGSVRGRATEMLVALYVFLDHPILGVGPGMIGYEMEEYSKTIAIRNLTTNREAHSLYLDEASETGILGFVTLMAIFLYSLYRLAIARTYWLERNRTDFANLCTGFFLAIISYMTTGIFLHIAYIRFLWLIMALAAVVSEFRAPDLADDLPKQNTKEVLSFAKNIP